MIGTEETCPECEDETVTSENIDKLCTYHADHYWDDYSGFDDDEQS